MNSLLLHWLSRAKITAGMMLATAILSVGTVQPAAAQIAQTPLLTQSGSVDPNLVLMFDDSLSMSAQFIYQFGGLINGFGRTGPGTGAAVSVMCPQNFAGISCAGTSGANYPTSPSITVTGSYNAPASTWYWEQSPDVNGLYYDPRVRYYPRLDSNGNYSTPGVTSTTAFNVYFYRSGGVNATWQGGTPDPTVSGSYFGDTILTPYTPAASLLAAGAQTLLTYPRSVATGTGPFPKFFNRTDCTGGGLGGNCTLADERQNYANWKKYHSNRMDLAKTGLGYAFYDLTSSIRLGWGTINTLNDSNVLDSGVSLYNQTQKDAFYLWLYGLTTDAGGTPNRKALSNVGSYFSRSDNLGPWATTPYPSSKGISTLATSTTDTLAIRAAQYSCRRSYSMLMTDGYYDADTPTIGNVDSTAITAITGTTALGATLSFSYNGTTRPYFDSNSNAMADVAMKYWITDLRTDLTNNVKKIDATVINGVTTTVANESFWQNMSFYAVGLGVYGTLNQNTTTLASLTSGGTSWPVVAAAGNTLETIDDMWHATINARGRVLSAKNASTLSDAVEGMLADINKNTASQSGVAASTASLSNGTRKYTPKYTTGTWTGNVVATALDPSTAREVSVTWQVVGTNPTTSTTYSGIPAYGSRNIYAWNGLTMGNFDILNTYVMSNVSGANTNLINYLRGDQSNEDPNGTGLYRPREFLLGDIVNSAPVFIKGALNAGYTALPAGTYGQSTYASFVASKAARSEGVLFAGANDGMLHGFRDTTGAEIFAFVPRAVMPNLHLLARKSYNHQYYVDGPNAEADACLSGGSSCTTWSNLLLGTAGAGAKTVYALDVTDPINMSASSIKWEITPSTTGYASLGHVLTEVQTGLTKSGDWVAIFGNGYYGSSTVASLYIANLDTGALIKQISTGVGGGNGLGGVRLVKDGNQRIIGAYAGDLKGNMWKFDLSSTSTSSWGLGLSNSPLYNATSTKPITAAPAVIAHPNGGSIVTFGTGKLFDTTDVINTATQSIYGIWDSVAFGSTTTPAGITQTGTTTLVQQTISAAMLGTTVATNSTGGTSTVTVSFFTLSKNMVDWATKRGWYINLPNTGQRLTYSMEELVSGSGLVTADTLSAANVSLDPCIQSGAGRAWFYVIDGVTGGAPSTFRLDTNSDRVITSSDLIASGIESAFDGKTKVLTGGEATGSGTTSIFGIGANSGGGGDWSGEYTPVVTPTVTGVVRRSWRQLFLR